MRVCSSCGVEKPDSEFYAARRSPTGEVLARKGQCRACIAARRLPRELRRRRSNTPVDREGGTLLPIGPFRAWLKDRLASDEYDGVDEFATALDTAHRVVWGWLHSTTTVHIDRVDRALIAEGSAMLRDVYPGLYLEDAGSVAA